MNSMPLKFILPIIYICYCKEIMYNHDNKENNIYFIFTTFRHGARKPLKKKDFFGNIENKPGALTEYGKIQHLEIGRKYRKRYANFMNISFDKNEIYIRSSNIERALVSTLKELEGFFNQTIDRSNIFIVKGGVYFMNLFLLDRKEHQDINKYLKNCLKRNLGKNYVNIYQNEIFPNLKNCHLKENIPDTGIKNFCDSIISHYFEYTYGNQTNDIIGRCNSEDIKKFYDFCIEYYDSFKAFKEYGAFMFYKLFQHIFKYMDNAIKGKSKLKMIMIGGHDATVGQLMYFLDALQIIPRTNYPHFAFNIIMELRKYNEEFYLEIYYNDIMKYNNTLKNFKNILDNSKYSNLYNYCGKPQSKLSLNKTINTKNGINILNKKNKIIKSLPNSINSTKIKTKNQSIVTFGKILLKKPLTYPTLKDIKIYIISIMAFITIFIIFDKFHYKWNKNKKRDILNSKKIKIII